jgi:hypothetical protein
LCACCRFPTQAAAASKGRSCSPCLHLQPRFIRKDGKGASPRTHCVLYTARARVLSCISRVVDGQAPRSTRWYDSSSSTTPPRASRSGRSSASTAYATRTGSPRARRPTRSAAARHRPRDPRRPHRSRRQVRRCISRAFASIHRLIDSRSRPSRRRHDPRRPRHRPTAPVAAAEGTRHTTTTERDQR